MELLSVDRQNTRYIKSEQLSSKNNPYGLIKLNTQFSNHSTSISDFIQSIRCVKWQMGEYYPRMPPLEVLNPNFYTEKINVKLDLNTMMYDLMFGGEQLEATCINIIKAHLMFENSLATIDEDGIFIPYQNPMNNELLNTTVHTKILVLSKLAQYILKSKITVEYLVQAQRILMYTIANRKVSQMVVKISNNEIELASNYKMGINATALANYVRNLPLFQWFLSDRSFCFNGQLPYIVKAIFFNYMFSYGELEMKVHQFDTDKFYTLPNTNIESSMFFGNYGRTLESSYYGAILVHLFLRNYSEVETQSSLLVELERFSPTMALRVRNHELFSENDLVRDRSVSKKHMFGLNKILKRTKSEESVVSNY